MNYDDIFFPMYLEFYHRTDSEFYRKYLPVVKKIFNNANIGTFRIKFTKAKSGAYCYTVTTVYKEKVIFNRIGYSTEVVALMSVVDALRNNKFENLIK